MQSLKPDIYLAFDMDGTLYDAAEFAAEAFQVGLLKAGSILGRPDIKPPSRDDIMKLVGCTAEEIYSSLFYPLTSGEQRVIARTCIESFVALISRGRGRLMPGAYGVIENFYREGFLLLTASNGSPDYVRAILRHYDLEKFFAKPLLFCEGDITDKSRILSIYKGRMKSGDLLIMIGDRMSDRIAAKENGLPFIGCAYGHAGDREIKGERRTVYSFAEIPDAVEDICREFFG